MNIPSAASLADQLAPQGVLRVAINLGNPVLAGLDAAGEPSGISAHLSRKLAAQLGLGIEWRVFKKADESVQCVRADEADIGFFAIDPVRGEGLHFSPPYVQIEGAYMVRSDSLLQSNDEVDQAGNRVTVGAGSAYDLFLTRHLNTPPSCAHPARPPWSMCSWPSNLKWPQASSSNWKPTRSACRVCVCCRADSWSSTRPWAYPRSAAQQRANF